MVPIGLLGCFASRVFASLAWIKAQAALSAALLFIKVANDRVTGEGGANMCLQRGQAEAETHDMNSPRGSVTQSRGRATDCTLLWLFHLLQLRSAPGSRRPLQHEGEPASGRVSTFALLVTSPHLGGSVLLKHTRKLCFALQRLPEQPDTMAESKRQ